MQNVGFLMTRLLMVLMSKCLGVPQYMQVDQKPMLVHFMSDKSGLKTIGTLDLTHQAQHRVKYVIVSSLSWKNWTSVKSLI